MFVLSLITLTIITITTLGLIAGSLTFHQNSKYTTNALQANNLAEAGIDKAVAFLNSSGGTYNGEGETQLGPGTYEVTVANISASNKLIKATGYIPDKENAKTKRSVQLEVSKGTGVAFNYGLQIGEGGLVMGNGAIIDGSLYSNGNITAGNTNSFTGDVYIAGGIQPTADQQTECIDLNCQDYLFGKNVAGSNILDVAQSFSPSATGTLNKVSLKLKKAGSTPNVTVRILTNNNNSPTKTVLTSGTLNANLVTNSDPPSFVDIPMSPPVNLNSSTNYWIMVDTSSDPSNYWSWSADSLQTYTPGAAKWSQNWNAGSPVWNSTTYDLGFKTYTGGVVTSFSTGNSSSVNGDVHANTISGGSYTISGDAYYQTISQSVTVSGTLYPGSQDPAATVFPVSDSNISEWKNEAETANVFSGNITGCNMNLGPGKYIGSLTLDNNCTVNITSPVWITGNIITGNSVKFKLSPSAGSSSGMVIVDGTTTLGNGCVTNSCGFLGSGTPGSYLMLLSIYDSRTNGNSALVTGNNFFSGIYYLPYGIVTLGNDAKFTELSAWKLVLGNNLRLNYDQGLANVFFSSGPSGSYSVIKGTYQSK
ncbi:MAG: hypothetical protein ACD_30C00112G0043 [uncultured bacterium]|uniref:Uncharacterized protein n=4 Tax=Candidatus Daviesiibacteriota TaxID=1752718 RepID=A0A0G0EYD2_9BACT|nr:MAG: hypothetical protein ACD_30C00112G0043 [uncultured bacterium]KKQ10537.1 MAG: hypothetical protein US19_C0003G0032 [Candidatus Daviesbacteria bacterium GW2011_GWB1_36_5]KKQ15280.1 MAG: hypothetical protein US28_C0019G0013 [Candidatus Daviesbacteria bacterium GW2011_GWA1_36_8]OGE17202.1 MAG: hypothetical protein A2858_00665 [Candidatus Daviesbacteria bacterium RIFCSPHIGHO2_01_FULL_36_37]OGE35983.1 MAG: hypothetical protein A3E66_01660 [Candidatus Daviesbacteria bacterium RIFCSPHIGHO2_12_F